jgi:hypothetical protein
MLDNFKDIVESAINSKHLIAVTHDGVFHVDDLLCTVFLRIFFEGTGVHIEVIRTRDKSKIPTGNNVIVYDFGGGILDHHDEEEVKVIDGRKLSSIGKLWRFGKEEFMNKFSINERMWVRVDRELIKPVDITDNGGKMNPLTFSINALRITENEGYKWSACIKTLETLVNSVLEAARILQGENSIMESLPIITINGKLFRFSEEWCAGNDENPKIRGIIWKHEDGTYKIKMFGSNILTRRGIKEETDSNIIYVNSNGKNGWVRKLKDLEKII